METSKRGPDKPAEFKRVVQAYVQVCTNIIWNHPLSRWRLQLKSKKKRHRQTKTVNIQHFPHKHTYEASKQKHNLRWTPATAGISHSRRHALVACQGAKPLMADGTLSLSCRKGPTVSDSYTPESNMKQGSDFRKKHHPNLCVFLTKHHHSVWNWQGVYNYIYINKYKTDAGMACQRNTSKLQLVWSQPIPKVQTTPTPLPETAWSFLPKSCGPNIFFLSIKLL